MRVISGKVKGHKLFVPKGLSLRPTSDLVKETLCNIIAADIPGATVLDAFAGTGNIGIEALSRGAERVVFIEKIAGACPYSQAQSCSVPPGVAKSGLLRGCEQNFDHIAKNGISI